MLSPDYFEYRWSWYRPILMQGESAAKRCRVDARRLPLCVPGEDAREYVPCAVEPALSSVFSAAVKRLHDYSIKYMVDGEKVSAHQLPIMSPLARSMFKHLQGLYPHLPISLLHHWCADEHGGTALLNALNGMWEQSWRQDKEDSAPWVPAVNVFILSLLRAKISDLSSKHPAHTDRVMVYVLGGLYDWALRAFLKQHVDGAVEMTRITTYETMIIPATPMAFLYQQPDVHLLADAPAVISIYGLDPDLVPRLRELRKKIGMKNEAGVIALVAKDRMGEHMLKRSWARLSLWSLAQKTKQGVWMQWVLDAKKLDALIARPESLPSAIVKLLESAQGSHPVAGWLLSVRDEVSKGKKAKDTSGKPWLQGEVVLNAFRVFEEDVKVEMTRRDQESLWLDKSSYFLKKQRNPDDASLMKKAYDEGEIVFFQQDTGSALHSGSTLASKQGCLRVDWSNYLTVMSLITKDRKIFLGEYFLPGIINMVDRESQVFLDDISASGCLLRGGIKDLVHVAELLKAMVRGWYTGVTDDNFAKKMPALSMCIALLGRWDFVSYKNKDLGVFSLAFSLSVSQANAGVLHDASVEQLLEGQEKKEGKSSLGKVRIGKLENGTGQKKYVLCNQGIALTSQAANEFVSAMQNKSVVKEFRPSLEEAQAVLPEYLIPEVGLKVICVRPRSDAGQLFMFIRVGRTALAGVDTEIYELLDMNGEVGKCIYQDGLPRWK